MIADISENGSGHEALLGDPWQLPESKRFGLHEFAAADLDGNRFRVFYDYAAEERERAR